MRILGIDAGGSGSRWLLADGSGRELRRGEAGPLQAAALGADGLAEGLKLLVEAAGPAEVGVVVAGVAGAGERALRDAANAAFARRGGGPELRIVTDIETVAGAALADAPGVVAWAGTGSFVVGRGEDGGLVRAGGRGAFLGDEGSAFDIVRRAARLALLQLDGVARGSPTLGQTLAAALGAPAVARLGVALQRAEVRAVAGLAPAVLELGAGGDALASRAAAESLAALADLVVALAERLRLAPGSARPVIGGGVLARNEAARALFAAALAERGVGEALVAGRAPVEGAVRLALAWLRREQPFCTWVEHGAA
jgi:N-acetylglucosamine kinase-like BadF-type ATPase